jgi:hypothetical protein
MEKQTKQLLTIGAVAVAAYWLWRNSKKVTTASSSEDKMAMTCAEGEKLTKTDYGMRCIPVSEVVPGPMPKVDVGGASVSFDAKSRLSADGGIVETFGNPNIVGVPVRVIGDNCPKCGISPCCCGGGPAWAKYAGNYANYVDTKSNSFFQAKEGGFYK